jgi:regulator of chromosome condensation
MSPRRELPTRTANTKGRKLVIEVDGVTPPSAKRYKSSADHHRKFSSKNLRPNTRLSIFVFGDGENAELGLGAGAKATHVGFPRLNPFLDPEKVGVVSLDCGGMHVVALTQDNQVLTWGINDHNLLLRDTTWEGGLRDAGESDSEDECGLNPLESTPAAIPAERLPKGVKIFQVAAGDSATFLLSEDGLVYGWGFFRVSPLYQSNLMSN